MVDPYTEKNGRPPVVFLDTAVLAQSWAEIMAEEASGPSWIAEKWLAEYRAAHPKCIRKRGRRLAPGLSRQQRREAARG